MVIIINNKRNFLNEKDYKQDERQGSFKGRIIGKGLRLKGMFKKTYAGSGLKPLTKGR